MSCSGCAGFAGPDPNRHAPGCEFRRGFACRICGFQAPPGRIELNSYGEELCQSCVTWILLTDCAIRTRRAFRELAKDLAWARLNYLMDPMTHLDFVGLRPEA